MVARQMDEYILKGVSVPQRSWTMAVKAVEGTTAPHFVMIETLD
jgi:hypothetical protein